MIARHLRFLFVAVVPAIASQAVAQGDNCASAVSVTPGTYTADGPASGSGFDGACFGAGSAFNGDWYVFTPAANGTIDVYSCDGGADTRLSVMTGTCGFLGCAGSSDDACQMCPGCSFFASQVLGVPVTAGTPIYIQWDDFWTTQSFNWVLEFNCANAPLSTTTLVMDCANNQFFLNVDIVSMGSAATVDILNNGGAPTVSGATVGTWTVGPFPLGTLVQLQLVNNSDPGCDFYPTAITNDPCPYVSCGPDNYTYCYGNGENTLFIYQGSSTIDPLAIYFNAGGMYNFGGDILTIYNGINSFAPILFSGFMADLTGQIWIASNPDNALTMQITTDGFTSCADFGVFPEWDYTVGCLDCTPATATFTPVMDCPNLQWFVDVNVTVAGSDPALDITNTGGAPVVTTSGVGTYTVGPFTLGVPVTITLENDANSLCNINSGALINPTICPVPVPCGFPPVNETYCYTDNDNAAWHWVSDDGTSPLALIFNAGQIESVTWDHLNIYDGPDNTYPLLYTHNTFATVDLTGLLVVSTQPDIYMEMWSDPSVSCGSGFFTAWDWTVGCLDCTVPAAIFTVVPDCIHREFSVEVNVTSTGDASVVDVVNTLNSDTAQNLALGTHLVGPFGMDSTVILTVLNGDNPLCRVYSDSLTWVADSCIIHSCGEDYYNYCYENSDNAWFTYQSTSGLPITITFTSGDMLAGDKILVHNGSDTYSALIFNGNNGGDLTGLSLNSANPDNILMLHIISNELGSCDDGSAPTPMNWKILCGFASVDESFPGEFFMYPNPTNGMLNIEVSNDGSGPLNVEVMDLAGRLVMAQTFIVTPGVKMTMDLNKLSTGNYLVKLSNDRWVRAQQVQVAR